MVVGSVSQGVVVVAGRASARADARRRDTERGPRPSVEPGTAQRRRDELPRSIRRAAGLETFADPEIALAPPARAAAAARAFSAGNGYLSGLIIDRVI